MNIISLLGFTMPLEITDEFTYCSLKERSEVEINISYSFLATLDPEKKNMWRIIESVIA